MISLNFRLLILRELGNSTQMTLIGLIYADLFNN